MNLEKRIEFLRDWFPEFEGFARILTIPAQGYMFESDTSSIDRARRALCAWCSVPDKKTASPKEGWQFDTDFSVLHEEFPELVDLDSVG